MIFRLLNRVLNNLYSESQMGFIMYYRLKALYNYNQLGIEKKKKKKKKRYIKKTSNLLLSLKRQLGD